MRSVLILGARAPVALDHARRFAAQGWKTHVADSVSHNLTGYSQSVTSAHWLPSPRYDGTGFVNALNRIITDAKIDLLIPTCEEVFFLARYRSQLPQQLMVATTPFETLRELHSKLEFMRHAEQCATSIPASRIHVPSTHAVETLDEARAWASNNAIVLKPEFSRFGVHVRLYPHGIPSDAPPLSNQGKWAAQSLCSGEELCSYSIVREGRLLAHATYRPLYRLGRSASFYFEQVEEPAINAFVSALSKKLNLSGQFSFDWIRESTGHCAVLECNPRATSGLHLFGRDAPLPNAFTTSDEWISPQAQPRMIAGMMVSVGLAHAVRIGELAKWRSDFARASDVLSQPNDHRPLWGAITDLTSYALAAQKNHCSMREAATRDIEWDGQPITTETLL